MQRITLEVILRTVFGVDEGSQLSDLRDALTAILDRQSSPMSAIFTIPPLRRRFLGLTPWDGFLRDLAHADSLIHRQITRRRTERQRGEPPRNDVLSMLLEAHDEEGHPMTDGEIRDELVTLLAAGHETTATMLCWTFDFILGDPRVDARVQREVEASDPERPMPYLDAVIKEVLRLRPVVPAVGRRISKPVKLGRWEIPAGELLVPVSFLTHRSASVYPEPESFKPERFLDTKPDPYAWFPFGGGARRCLGMTFSLYEMRIVLAAVLARLEMRKRHPAPAEVSLRGFTIVPRGGTEVIVQGPARRVSRQAVPEVAGAAL
jgi:cytochrome P450